MPFDAFMIISIVIGVLAAAVFVFVIVLMFSPKIRGKMMSKGIKAAKYMMDESKDDIKSITTDMAESTEDALGITTRAIRKGLTKDEQIFCKHCGQKIDKDSKFCSKCGKEL